MKCDIVMVTWHNARMTEDALASIHASAQYPYRLILIDNGSDRPTVAMLDRIADTQEYGETLLVKNSHNAGWLRATNQGIALSDAPYVCLMNTDVLAGHNWLKNMVACLERFPQIGLANPRGNRTRENRRAKNRDAYAARLERERGGQYCELDHCRGFCMLVRRTVLEKVGALDEAFGQGFFEDNDFSRRVQQAGYLCVRVEDAFVHHLKHQSFGTVPDVTRALYASNRPLYEARWGRRRRYFVLPRHAVADDLLALARGGALVYVVSNRFVHPRSFTVPHKSIRFYRGFSMFPLDRLFFALKGRQLLRKGKVDQCVVLGAAGLGSLEPTGPQGS